MCDVQHAPHPRPYHHPRVQTVPLPGAVIEQPDGDIMYGAGQRSETAPLNASQYPPPGVAHV